MSWTASQPGPLDGIGLYKATDPNAEHVWWADTHGAPSGTVTLAAPTEPGPYEFRYLVEGHDQVARSRVVTVTVAVYTLTPSRSTVPPGGELSVSWTASIGSPEDAIALYREGASDANHGWWQDTHGATSGRFTLTAPTEPGSYEFRYVVLSGRESVARSRLVTVGR